MSAKTASLISKIIAIVIILAGEVLKGFQIMPGLSSWEIIVVGVAVAMIFVTVDINILVDKFTNGQAQSLIKNVESVVVNNTTTDPTQGV